ncbi:hypothetical protein HaLaN_10552 [Haematococcus lacustris]|uniref:Uncharacterized protein n=1 Tax=Haematococcus lacustris TaxID=44745 RepID=A0A699Z555_HAELA|nr:hypothetical protein HaLaN_10552 [Haematococcus lacustris]
MSEGRTSDHQAVAINPRAISLVLDGLSTSSTAGAAAQRHGMCSCIVSAALFSLPARAWSCGTHAMSARPPSDVRATAGAARLHHDESEDVTSCPAYIASSCIIHSHGGSPRRFDALRYAVTAGPLGWRIVALRLWRFPTLLDELLQRRRPSTVKCLDVELVLACAECGTPGPPPPHAPAAPWPSTLRSPPPLAAPLITIRLIFKSFSAIFAQGGAAHQREASGLLVLIEAVTGSSVRRECVESSAALLLAGPPFAVQSPPGHRA